MNSTPKISSQSHLEEVVKEISAEIDPNFDTDKIICKYDASTLKSSRPGQKYLLEVNGPYTHLSTVKHEVYHIIDGHVDKKSNLESTAAKLTVTPWYETQAMLYEITGLKL